MITLDDLERDMLVFARTNGGLYGKHRARVMRVDVEPKMRTDTEGHDDFVSIRWGPAMQEGTVIPVEYVQSILAPACEWNADEQKYDALAKAGEPQIA